MIASIVFDILGPSLVLVLLGAWVRRAFRVDVASLSKLNIYLFVPGFFFDHVVHSTLGLGQAAGVVFATLLQVAVLGLLVWGGGRALGVNRRTLAAVAMCVMFYNSGNFGLALSELAYPGEAGRSAGVSESRSDWVNAATPTPTPTARYSGTPTGSTKNGSAAQAFVVFTQNLLNFSVGLMIAKSAGGGSLRDGLRAFLRMPTLYVITAALFARWWRADGHEVPKLVTATAAYLSKGLVPVALVTLGAQLASAPRWRPVSFVMAARLVWGPVQMAALLYGLHVLFRGRSSAMDLWPWPAENLVLTAGVPTAVNVLLVTLEVGGDAELTADCVFWTTIGSAATITGWLVVARASGVFPT
ncbi:MAG: family transporter [Phycisphaerales bacterium]|nr:family transporter [Phycisphaerales bacterium]